MKTNHEKVDHYRKLVLKNKINIDEVPEEFRQQTNDSIENTKNSHKLVQKGINNPITIWSTISEEGNVKHNHIQNGHVEGGFPLPLKPEFTNQRAWAKMEWKKEFGYLVNNVVLRSV